MVAKKHIDWDKVKELAAAGGTWISISAQIGMSFSCLKSRAKAEIPELFKKIRNNGLNAWGQAFTKIDRVAAVEMRKRGMTHGEIAKLFGATATSCQKMLSRKSRVEKHRGR